MEETTTTISVCELKKLIATINEQKSPIRIRFRVLGQLWYPNFLRVVQSEKDERIIFRDERRNRTIYLSDLSAIGEFELSGTRCSFESGCRYQMSEAFVQIDSDV